MASANPEGIERFDSGRPGRALCITFGVHGNERSPIDAGQRLLEELGARKIDAGRLLVVHANPKASAEDQRWSRDGVDLNRCFHRSVLEREPALYEEGRAREIVQALEDFRPDSLVDFHCTVEPGRRFLMQHPAASHVPSQEVVRWLSAEVLLCDPELHFGGVSLDEWMTTRGLVGICYETGWIGDPANSQEAVLAEMHNLLRGLGLVAGPATRHADKNLLELRGVVSCEEPGFQWTPGIGENLQPLPAGTRLGRYASGREVRLEADATLVFPKKRPELVQPGKPLVYLAHRAGR